MSLPNFLIIGAQKCGTTWLQAMLRQHPDVYMPPGEVHYFDSEINFGRGVGWYEQHFGAAEHASAIGEKTPGYLWVHGPGTYWVHGRKNGRHLPNINRTIYHTLPGAKLIALLRNPVERAISHVNHLMRDGHVSPLRSLDELFLGASQVVEQNGVLDRGRYSQHIKAYREYFDSDQILVLILEEDIVQHPVVALQKVTEFLGIDGSFEFSRESRRRNAPSRSRLRLVLDYYLPLARSFTWRIDRARPPWKGCPRDSVVRELYRLYAEANEELFELLRRRPPSWEPQRHGRG